jgi:hypothetical protein
MTPLTPELLALTEGYPEPDRRLTLIVLQRKGYDISSSPSAHLVPPKPERHATVATLPVDGLTEKQALEKFPCFHRGEPLGMHICKPCQGSRQHTIFACALRGVCTARASGAKYDGKCVAVCLACDDRVDGDSLVPLGPIDVSVEPSQQVRLIGADVGAEAPTVDRTGDGSLPSGLGQVGTDE